MFTALGFLSILGRSSGPTPSALRWFAPVGALIGMIVAGSWWAAAQWWPPLVAAIVAVTVDAVITGMLHLDGMADCGDGLLAPMDRARRLVVMRTPEVGAFGATALFLVLGLRVATLASLSPDAGLVVAVAALWASSRICMALCARVVRYARAEGLASAFIDEAAVHGAPVDAYVVAAASTLAIGAVAAAVAVTTDALIGGLHVVGALVACGVTFAAVVAFAHRRLGGYTGDVLGAAGVVAETVGLLVLVAR